MAPAPPWLFPAASCSGALCCSDILLIHCSSTVRQQHTHRQSTIRHACSHTHTDVTHRRKVQCHRCRLKLTVIKSTVITAEEDTNDYIRILQSIHSSVLHLVPLQSMIPKSSKPGSSLGAAPSNSIALELLQRLLLIPVCPE